VSLPNINKTHNQIVGGERKGVNRVLVGKYEGKKPLGRPRRT
jgi:hypothetical protein